MPSDTTTSHKCTVVHGTAIHLHSSALKMSDKPWCRWKLISVLEGRPAGMPSDTTISHKCIVVHGTAIHLHSSALNMSNRPGCWWKSMRGFGGRPAGMSCNLMTGPENTGPRSSWNSFRLSARTMMQYQLIVAAFRASTASHMLELPGVRQVSWMISENTVSVCAASPQPLFTCSVAVFDE